MKINILPLPFKSTKILMGSILLSGIVISFIAEANSEANYVLTNGKIIKT